MILKYDEETDRYNGLHCGQGLKLKSNGKWHELRIEKAKEWYVIDQDGNTCPCKKLEGCEIEIDQ